jgi:hypothetical protein
VEPRPRRTAEAGRPGTRRDARVLGPDRARPCAGSEAAPLPRGPPRSQPWSRARGGTPRPGGRARAAPGCTIWGQIWGKRRGERGSMAMPSSPPAMSSSPPLRTSGKRRRRRSRTASMPRRAMSAAACRSHSPPTNGPRRRRSRRSRPARWSGRSAHQGRNRPGGAQHPPIWGQRGASATATAPSRPPTASAPAARGRGRPRRRGRCRGTAPSDVRPRRQRSGGRCLSPAAPPAQLRPYSASRLSRQGRPAASRRGGGHNLKATSSAPDPASATSSTLDRGARLSPRGCVPPRRRSPATAASPLASPCAPLPPAPFLLRRWGSGGHRIAPRGQLN